eukprot:163552_1
MVENRDLYVFKLLHDISFVLELMWKNQMIDRDVGCANILMAGNLLNYESTSFIKVDYGEVVSINSARKQLVNGNLRRKFCHFGVNSSPIDVRIISGKLFHVNNSYTVQQWLDKQIDSTYAAKKLSNELQSIDIIDLTSAAIAFYNKLTIDDGDKLHLYWIGRDHSEVQRQWIVKHNWYMLNKYYNATKYYNPWIIPVSIKDMLIKIQWLSFMQLPENEHLMQDKTFLNWNVFRFWLGHIYDVLE